MDKFDGMLICTDFDSTLSANGVITEKNIEAIKYFQQNGGVFTIVSGRLPEYLRGYESMVVPNTFVCGLNGAKLMDLKTGEVPYRLYLGQDGLEFAFEEAKKLPYISEIHLHTDSGAVAYRRANGDFDGKAPVNDTVYKILFLVPDGSRSDETKAVMEKDCEGRFAFSRSWINGLEIQNIGIDKGKAVGILRSLLGDRARYVIGFGDYENDIPLLRAADYAVAVRNAVPELLNIADYVTSSAAESSIADVIYRL